jgi:putative sigma-54 modulation protein
MNVIIQSLGFKAGSELEDYVRSKIERIKPNEGITGANVVLFMGPNRATPNDYCEIRLEVPGNDLFVKESAMEFEQAVDSAVNKLENMLRKTREKIIDRSHGRVHGQGR